MALNLSNSLKYKLKSTIDIVSTIFFDAIKMIFWVFIQYSVDCGVNYFQLKEFSFLISQIFQILLAVSTLIPVLYYIFKDFIRMINKLNAAMRIGYEEEEIEEELF